MRTGSISSSVAQRAISVLGLVLALAGATCSAASAAPVLSATVLSVPTNLPPGGTGFIRVDLQNLGNAATDGTPVTVVDTLPPGLTATEAGAIKVENSIEPGIWDCSGTTTVTCTSDPVGLPVIIPIEATREFPEGPPAPSIGIAVEVSSEAEGVETNTVEVTGGGTSETALNRQNVTISPNAPPFGFASFNTAVINSDGSMDTQAGSHPYSIITHFILNNVGSGGSQIPVGNGLKDLEVDLPTGLVGDPLATPRCPRALFDAEQYVNYPRNCPVDTQIGYDTVELLNDSFRTTIPVYNLVPPPGVPAQFGFAFQKDIGFINPGVRTGEGYGLKVTLRNVAQLGLIGNILTLWGTPADSSHNVRRDCEESSCPSNSQPEPLLTNPGSCGQPQSMGILGDAWKGGESFRGTFPITNNREQQSVIGGCERLSFEPTIKVHPDTTLAESPSGLEVDIHLPQSEGPETLARSDLRDATVTLPSGMAISPSAASGLGACSPEQIGLDNANSPACPDSSKVGVAEVITPVLPTPLKGSVYLAQQDNNPFGSLIALYLVVEGNGVLVKLPGEVALDSSTGQLTTTFKDNPQLPFSDLKLKFFGGPRAALVTPAACGTYSTSASLSPWSGLSAALLSDSFSIGGCQGGFSPSFVAGTTNNQASGYSPLTVTFARQDREQRLSSATIQLPPGLLGVVKSVPRCEEPQATEGTCSPASLIGHTTVSAGPGSEPFSIGGNVYFTGPYGGAPFGLSIVTHVVAGPFDLGNVIVRAAVSIDPRTAQITVKSDPFPTILKGIPLDLRTISVSIDRPGFTFNPTNCSTLGVNATITSTGGTGSPASTPFQAANCAGLAFRPGFAASTTAKTSKKNGAGLDVKLTSALGQADIAKVHVALPKQLPSRLTTLQKACLASVFDTNPAGCGAGSIVGSATILTPLLAAPLVGPAYLVSHAGAAFPDLVMVLQGEGVTLELVGNTDIKKGITSSTFNAVPDAPFSTFDLKLPQGPGGLLTAYGSLCKAPLTMPTTLTGQNGVVSTRSTKIAVSGCPKHTAKKKAAKTKKKGKK